MIKIKKIIIPQIVKIRKNEVNKEELQQLLRAHKKRVGLTNNDIASKLNVPLTKVSHWFRTDSYFAIPEDNIWFNLKELLQIDTKEFDNSIMEFEYKEGTFEQTQRYYSTDGLSPTITTLGDINIIEEK